MATFQSRKRAGHIMPTRSRTRSGHDHHSMSLCKLLSPHTIRHTAFSVFETSPVSLMWCFSSFESSLPGTFRVFTLPLSQPHTRSEVPTTPLLSSIINPSLEFLLNNTRQSHPVLGQQQSCWFHTE